MSEQPRLTRGLLLILGFLTMASALSIDLYLPAFTAIARDLETSAASVQLTLTAFFFGMCVGQLVIGALSDRWGRRPVLLVALALFAAASTLMVFSPNIAVFIALRAVQGFSGAAGVVLGRAITVDLTGGTDAVRALSLLAMLTAFGPLVAPLIGGVTSEWWGWRGSLAVLAGFTVAMLALSILRVPDTLPREQRQTGGLGASLRVYRDLLRDGRFALLTVGFALTFVSIMGYVAASPFVAQLVLGMGPTQYAVAFAAGAAGLALANMLNASLAVRFGAASMLRAGSGLLLVAASAMLAFVLTGTLSIASFVACGFSTSFAVGLILPNSTALALARADRARGSGSALLGATQFMLGGLASPVVGAWGERTALPMAGLMVGAALVVAVCTVFSTRSPGPPGSPTPRG